MAHGTPARAQDLPPPPVDYVAVIYTLRNTDPAELIRMAWADAGPAQVERALLIACRESGLGKGSGRTWQEACSPSHRVPTGPHDSACGVPNAQGSGAVGLFQTVGGHRARAQRLGLSWQDVAGPDCLADVILAHDIWTDSGWAPWAL